MAIAGSAVAVSGADYVLRPVSAYAAVCGGESSCHEAWTAMCCTIGDGVNTCPPGSFAGGWWKAVGANLCGGKARYYVDCQAECTGCRCAPGSHFCGERCWNCRPHCADHGTCDNRRVCHNVFRYGQCERDRHCAGPVLCRAVSCTPPWKWANCSTAAATDQATVSHSAPCLPRWTAIQRRYTELGSQASLLGATVHREIVTRRARIQRYELGRMYWSPRTGAHYLRGEILEAYLRLGQTSAPVGLPTTDSHELADRTGYAARFQHGGIFRSHGRPLAHALWGPLWSHYKAVGLTGSKLGYPVTDVETVREKNVTFAHFDGGAMYKVGGHRPWSFSGRIGATYRANGYHRGALGYPRSGIRAAADSTGYYALFDGGSIYQGPDLDAFAAYGPIGQKYAALGFASSPLGYPVSAITGITTDQGSDGQLMRFQDGAIVVVSPAQPFAVFGRIYAEWVSQGGSTGRLGYPTSDVVDVDQTHQQASFEHGTVTYDRSADTVQVVLTP